GAVADWLLWRSNRTGRIPVFSSASALLLLAAAFVYGSWRIAGVEKLERQAKQVAVGLAQPNVGEVELHYNPRASVRILHEQTVSLYTRGAEVVIWPEVGFNTRPVRLGDRSIAREIQGGVPVEIIAGVIRVEGNDTWNSAVVISKDGAVGD